MDRLLFAEDESANGVEADNNSLSSADKWKILIVDDEQDVHDVTVLTLKRLEFESRGLTFLNAYSAAEYALRKVKPRDSNSSRFNVKTVTSWTSCSSSTINIFHFSAGEG